ncbi:MAG TPA: hypothetical protein VHR66_19170 [Gemmataceae bacterium]|jgi:hypothetical protein|nr:hypothetical protein [Gemmataceae bacterium]
MSEVMTRSEIEAQFPDEWILVIDPETGPDLRVRSGVLAAHSKSRDEVYRIAIAIKPSRSAVWYNGNPVPVGTALLL